MRYQLILVIVVQLHLCVSLNPPGTEDTFANLTAKLNELERKVNGLANAVNRDDIILKQHVNDSAHSKRIYFTAKVSDDLTGLGTNQVISFKKILVEEGHGYDTMTGIFTAPVAGTYLFIANMMNKPSASPDLETFITKNGIHMVRVPCNNGDHYASCSGTLVTRLAIGERVWMEHDIGGTVDKASYFSGVLINAD